MSQNHDVHTKKKYSSSFHPPLYSTHRVSVSPFFAGLFSKLLDLHLHDQRIARHHRLTELHLFLEKKKQQKNISGYTSRTSWTCVCLVGCDWCICKNCTSLVFISVLIFHYLVETNAEVSFCCAVSLCLDADYLRRFRMFTSWRRPAKGHHRCPQRALDLRAAYRPRRPIAPKPSLLEANHSLFSNLTFKLTGNMVLC